METVLAKSRNASSNDRPLSRFSIASAANKLMCQRAGRKRL